MLLRKLIDANECNRPHDIDKLAIANERESYSN